MYTSKMIIIVRRDLKMRKGKIAAQSGHACVNVVLAALCKEKRLDDVILEYDNYIELKESDREATPLSEWFKNGMAKICVYVDSEEELLTINDKIKQVGLLSSVIQDAGFTEFHGIPTITCLAVEPAIPEIIDPITGDLPLY